MAETTTKGGQRGERNPNWKGGRSVTSHGYVLIRVGKNHPLADVRGYVYEHRLKVWETGQDVEGKHVHHEDEDKQHNSLNNLKALTVAEHRLHHRKPDSQLRQPGEPNPVVSCECGCGTPFDRYDAWGRPRRFAQGHNPQASSTADRLIELLLSGVTRTADLIIGTKKTKGAVLLGLTRLRRDGIVENVRYGEWRIVDGRRF